MEWMEVTLEEYKLLRTESMQAMNNQHSILQVGTAAAAALIAAGFGLWTNEAAHPITIVIFLFFVPVACYLSLVIWIGEVGRMMKVGRYIANLEIRISEAFEMEKTLNWENWLRTVTSDGQTPQMKWNYKAIISLFFFIAGSSFCMGIKKIGNFSGLSICAAIVSFSILVSAFLYIRYLGLKMEKS